MLALTVAHISGRRPARVPPSPTRRLRDCTGRPTLSATPYQLYAAADWSSLPWLDRVPHPNLIVEGEEDRSVPLRIAPLLVARLPDARLHVVKGGGHPFLLEEPHTRAARARPSWTSTDGPTSNWARL